MEIMFTSIPAANLYRILIKLSLIVYCDNDLEYLKNFFSIELAIATLSRTKRGIPVPPVPALHDVLIVVNYCSFSAGLSRVHRLRLSRRFFSEDLLPGGQNGSRSSKLSVSFL